MRDYRDNMFAVPIVHIQSRDWERKQKILSDLFSQVKIEPFGQVLTNYSTDYKILNNHIQDLFDEELDLFLNQLNVGTKKVESSWFELAKTGSYHDVHTHGPCGYSAVCFVKFDPSEHEPTVFLSPFFNFLDGNVLTYTPEVNEGSLIFFPSTIIHHTNPNDSQKERIILSFNLR